MLSLLSQDLALLLGSCFLRIWVFLLSFGVGWVPINSCDGGGFSLLCPLVAGRIAAAEVAERG